MCYLFWDEICKIIRKREGEKIMKRLTVIFMAICMTLITACGSKSEEVGKGLKKVAKAMVSVLNGRLKTDANSASCGFVHQPKVPAGLDKFKKK